jgi:hypothetical protein
MSTNSASAPELQPSDTPEAAAEVGSSPTNLLTDDDRILQGREARARLRRVDSFEDWLTWGVAIAIGHARIEREVGASSGFHFNRRMGDWLRRNSLDGLSKTVRSELLDCLRNRAAILAFLAGLEERRRFRLAHPSSILRAWKRSTGQLQQRPPRAAANLTESLRSAGFETFLEKMPPEWREKLEERIERQTEALDRDKTHNKAASKSYAKILRIAAEGDAEKVLEAAKQARTELEKAGRELRDVAVYFHRTTARQTSRTDRRGDFTVVNGQPKVAA